MAEALDIGTLSGRIELEDRMSNILTLTEKALEKFEEREKDAGKGAEHMAEGVFKGELALEALKKAGELALEGVKETFDMMLEGGKILDVEEAFKRMSEDAGVFGEKLVSEVGAAMKGTVHDVDIMERANENMAAGLALSNKQMETLAKGAWALSKAMGIDARDALDRLSDAMVTGRTRGIAMLTGKIDLTAAEERFAKALGVSTDHLTEEGKMEAIRQTILERVAASTERIGETTLRFGDKARQAEVQWEVFWEKVSVGLAESPVLATMIDTFSAAFSSAFGTNQAERVKTVVSIVETVATTMMSVGEVATDVAGVIGVAWYKTKETFDTFMIGVYGLEQSLAGIALYANMAGEALGFPGAKESVAELRQHLTDVEAKMAEWADTADRDAKAADEWAVTTGKFKDVLAQTREKMEEAHKTAGEHAKTTEQLAHAEGEAAEKTEAAAEATNKHAYTMAKTKEEAKKYEEAMKELHSSTRDFHETVALLDKDMVASIKEYLTAGVSQSTLATAYGLTAAQLSAINKEREEESKQMKIEADAASELTKMWVAYSAQKAMLTATDTDKARIAAEADYQIAVENAQKKHIVDKNYYDQLAVLRDKNIELDEQARLLQDERSLSALELRIAKERDNYQFMLRHGRDYTDATIDQQYEIWQALEKQRDQWGKIGNQIDADTGSVNQMAGAVATLSGQMSALYESTVSSTQAANVGHGGSSWAVTKDSLSVSLEAAHQYGVSMELATAMAELGYSYGEILGYRALEENSKLRFGSGSRNKKGILQKMIEDGELPAPQGPRIPGFRYGGVGDFGAGTLVMLHGKEAITPLDGAGGVGGAGIPMTNHFYVNGTAADVARQISAEIMRNLASQRQLSLGS